MENAGPNGTKNASKLKPWASKIYFFEILMDLGQLVFLMVLGTGKRRAKKANKSTFGRQDDLIMLTSIIQLGHYTGRF